MRNNLANTKTRGPCTQAVDSGLQGGPPERKQRRGKSPDYLFRVSLESVDSVGRR